MKQNKRLKLGVISAVSIVGIVAIAILLNVLIGKLNISWDMTSKGIYTISDQTKQIVRGLEQDITIYVLNSEEGFPIDYKQILQQYEKNSKHIKILYRDLNVYSGFASEFTDEQDMNADSIIVVCGDKHVYLDSEDFMDMVLSEDYSAYNISYELEPLLTAAINTVNDGETAVIYQTTGHNELSLTSSVQTGLIRDNYSVKDLSLLGLTAVPEDADIILIHAPTTDFSNEDCEKLQDFMEQGGSIYYIMEAEVTLENLEALMKQYGIEAVEGVVLEQDTSMIYGTGTEYATPTYIIPRMEDTEITHDLYAARLPIIVPVAKGLVEHSGSGYTVTGLVSTSDYAFSKVNLNSSNLSREDEDIVGPFYLAVLSEKENAGKMIVLSSSNVLADDVNEVVSGNNNDFFLNGLNYLIGDTDKISIRGKEIGFDYNVYTGRQVYSIGGMAIIGIPVIIILAGGIVVVRRKRRSQVKQTEMPEDTSPEDTSPEAEEEQTGQEDS